MKKLRFSKVLLVVSIFCAATVIASAQTFTTLAYFNVTNGAGPVGPLVQGTNGNLYGTTLFGGTGSRCTPEFGCGSVFEMNSAGKVTALYSFCTLTGCVDGDSPEAGLMLGANGNLYGTTFSGGLTGLGTVFEITPAGKLTTLYSFCSQINSAGSCTNTDGINPEAGLAQGVDGDFYGTTHAGGTRRGGTVFRMTPSGALTIVYNFCSKKQCADGAAPYAGLVQGSNGFFYGATSEGGAYNGGTIFEIGAAGRLTTLYSFCSQPNCADGDFPARTPIQATNGNFYGTTSGGGANSLPGGTIFEMTPEGVLTTIYSFCSQVESGVICLDGKGPDSLVQATDGNFYGTTTLGGAKNAGTAFEISATGQFTQLYSFCSKPGCSDGEYAGALAQLTNGTLYGLSDGGRTIDGCPSGCGTIFSLSLGLGPFVQAVPGFAEVGRVVGILGNNLTGTTSVTFSGASAAFTVVSGTLIKATVPAGATTGTIEVTTPSGTLSSNVAFQIVP